jgi:DNA-binding NtrC family response regulator
MALGASVLVVDDDEGIRRTISEALELEGFAVEAAATGKQAREAVQRQMFNVALIDIKLPDMNGIELLDQLAEVAGPRMVKIIMTGYPDLKSAVDAVNKNADGYLFKPIDIWKLLKTIQTNLRRKTDEYIRAYVHQNQPLQTKKQKHPFW